MLAIESNFTKWDDEVATKMNLHLSSSSAQGEPADFSEQSPEWEDVLEAACKTDTYLSQHFNDIYKLLNLIRDMIEGEMILDEKEFKARIQSILDKSSVTVVNDTVENLTFNDKHLIAMLHDKVGRRINELEPNIKEVKPKKNTGNGGFSLTLPDMTKLEVIFRPKARRGKVRCEIILATLIARPERLFGKSFDEIKTDQKVQPMLEAFDRCISPLLVKTNYFEGRTFPEARTGTYFKSFSDEQAFRHKQGWLPKHISNDVTYWVNLPSEELFADKAVVNTIAEVIVAAYRMRKAALTI